MIAAIPWLANFARCGFSLERFSFYPSGDAATDAGVFQSFCENAVTTFVQKEYVNTIMSRSAESVLEFIGICSQFADISVSVILEKLDRAHTFEKSLVFWACQSECEFESMSSSRG